MWFITNAGLPHILQWKKSSDVQPQMTTGQILINFTAFTFLTLIQEREKMTSTIGINCSSYWICLLLGGTK